MLVKGRIIITGAGEDAAARQADVRNNAAISKSCAPFISCKSGINNTEIDNAKDIDILMPMYNLIEYCNNYVKISGKVNETFKNKANEQKRDFLVCY